MPSEAWISFPLGIAIYKILIAMYIAEFYIKSSIYDSMEIADK